MYRAELSKVRQVQTGYSRLAFDAPKFVKIVRSNNATVVPSDSLVIQFKATDIDNIHVVPVGDTLFVSGEAPVIIFTGKRDIVAIGSDLLVKGDLKYLDPFSLSVNLRDSHLYSLPISNDSKVSQQLEDFRINGNGTSVIDLSGRFDIGHLYLTNITEFNCSNEIGLRETDFYFNKDANVQSMTCREGMNIVVR
jgi:hypothetical protein